MSGIIAKESRNNQVAMKEQRIDNPIQIRPTKRLFSINEAAVYLGRTVCALREMLWAGKIPYVKDGKRILLDIKDMEAWIEKNKTQNPY